MIPKSWVSLSRGEGLPQWLSGPRRPGLTPGLRMSPGEREWPPAPVFLPGESYGQRSLAVYSSWGRKESYMTERHTHSRGGLGDSGSKTFSCPFLITRAPWGERPSAGWQTWLQSSGLPGPPSAGVRTHTVIQGSLSPDSCCLMRQAAEAHADVSYWAWSYIVVYTGGGVALRSLLP